MDESFQDYLQISELFKPSILKLDEIFMPNPSNFGNEFDKIRQSDNNDIPSTSSQTKNNCTDAFVSANNHFDRKSLFSKYKVASTQFSKPKNNLDTNIIISSQNIQTEFNSKSPEKNEQIKQDQLFKEDVDISLDDFAKIFAPVVSQSLSSLPPENVHSLVNEMFHQSQLHLKASQS